VLFLRTQLEDKLQANNARPRAIPAPQRPAGWLCMAWLGFEDEAVVVLVGEVVVVPVRVRVLEVVGEVDCTVAAFVGTPEPDDELVVPPHRASK